MEIIKSDFVKDFVRVCKDGFRMGWHEHNGGNLSYRLKPEDIRQIKDCLKPEQEHRDIGRDIPGLGDEYFLITGTGKHFRDIPVNPSDNIGIIKLDEDGEDYTVVWGYDGFCPTCELPAHLIAHDIKKHTDDHRVIYHCHPANLMSLTFVLPKNGRVFSRMLWQMLTEAAIVFPKGVEVIEWMTPGQVELAEATGDALKHHDAVVWAHHGLFVSGADFRTAFGIIQTIEKAAEIAVKVISMGGKKHGITRKNLKTLSDTFDLNINV